MVELITKKSGKFMALSWSSPGFGQRSWKNLG